MFDILKTYLKKEPHYVIFTDDFIYIKNYKRIYELTEKNILIDIDGLYKITGDNFKLVRNDNKELEISGCVESIKKS